MVSTGPQGALGREPWLLLAGAAGTGIAVTPAGAPRTLGPSGHGIRGGGASDGGGTHRSCLNITLSLTPLKETGLLLLLASAKVPGKSTPEATLLPSLLLLPAEKMLRARLRDPALLRSLFSYPSNQGPNR